METFAQYMLQEENLASKMEITYYLAKKTKIFFDKSVIFKTEMARLFLNYASLPEIDANLVLTACLLYSCKKVDLAKSSDTIKQYTKQGAQYLSTIGFDPRFCTICEQANRYYTTDFREKESDILELVDQFSGMILDRPERIGLQISEAAVLLEYRNLKEVNNQYLKKFLEFIHYMEHCQIGKNGENNAFQELLNVEREAEDVKRFITALIYDYEPQIDEILQKDLPMKNTDKFQRMEEDPNRPLFSEEITKKIIGNLV